MYYKCVALRVRCFVIAVSSNTITLYTLHRTVASYQTGYYRVQVTQMMRVQPTVTSAVTGIMLSTRPRQASRVVQAGESREVHFPSN